MMKKINEYGLPEPIISEGEKITTTVGQAYATKEVARLLSIPVEELVRMRDENCGPKYEVVDQMQKGLVLYLASDLTDWLRERDGKTSATQNNSDKS